mgnify:CR=1 FL=1
MAARRRRGAAAVGPAALGHWGGAAREGCRGVNAVMLETTARLRRRRHCGVGAPGRYRRLDAFLGPNFSSNAVDRGTLNGVS